MILLFIGKLKHFFLKALIFIFLTQVFHSLVLLISVCNFSSSFSFFFKYFYDITDDTPLHTDKVVFRIRLAKTMLNNQTKPRFVTRLRNQSKFKSTQNTTMKPMIQLYLYS